MKILVTGATGYIGGRLIPRLLEAGYGVRVLVRDGAARLGGRAWADKVEVFEGDLLGDPAKLESAFEGVDCAYYLVHSMIAGRHFHNLDCLAASNFVRLGGGLRHVIYLGGLLPAGDKISAHLASRAKTGEILRAGLPTTEFRAGPIIGSGSASFEMVRYLTERLPLMIAPRRILNQVQPVAIRDVLSYLIAAVERGPLGVLEIGSDRLTFRDMLQVYASVRGLRRYIFALPLLTTRPAGIWVGLVTPIPNNLAIPLVEGVIAPILADTARARKKFPEIHPIPYREAVERALDKIRLGDIETRWSGAQGSGAVTYERSDWEGLIRETRTLLVPCQPEAAFAAFSSLGGDRGWLAWQWSWWIRGLFDRLIGGPGLRRGRRHPTEILPGEAIDFWRVEKVEVPHLLRLRAEMKVPGKAWLQWEAIPEDGGTRLVQTALFEPQGLGGFLYWHVLYPIHKPIFSDLIAAIGRLACAGVTPQLR